MIITEYAPIEKQIGDMRKALDNIAEAIKYHEIMMRQTDDNTIDEYEYHGHMAAQLKEAKRLLKQDLAKIERV